MSCKAISAFANDSDRRAQKSAADSRVRDARAREIEVRNAVRLIEIDEAMAIIEEMIGLFRAETAGLPARVTRDLQFRKTIEIAVNDLLALWQKLALLARPSRPAPPDLWAAENRIYPQTAAVPGPRDPTLTPYVVEPERMIASGKYRRAVLVFGAQTGKSELMLDCAGQRLDQRSGPILYVGPNKQFLTEHFEPRVLALLDQSPTLTAKLARGKRMTKTRKMVGGVPFRLAHSGSSTALKSDPAVLALIDEYDEMVTNVNQQGGPLGLVERRGDTYADFVCVVTSTPKRGQVATVEDQKSKLVFWDVAMSEDIESPIWQLWQQGTRHHWCWPCPHCGEYFVPRFSLCAGRRMRRRWRRRARPIANARIAAARSRIGTRPK